MTDSVDREALAAILQRLGSADDVEALAAARAAHAAVAAAGVTWQDVLDERPGDPEPANDDTDWDDTVAADEPANDGDDWQDGTGDDMTDGTIEPGVAESPAGAGRSSDADILRLIDRMMAQEKDDPEFCAELAGYRQDIAAGTFDDRDRAYIRDLSERLRRA